MGEYEEIKKILESGSTDVNVTDGKRMVCVWTGLVKYGLYSNIFSFTKFSFIFLTTFLSL